jgi:cell division protein FtsB
MFRQPSRYIRCPAPRRLALVLGAAFVCAAPAALADEAALRAEIAELRAEVAEMKAQMKQFLAQGKPVQPAPTAPAQAEAGAPQAATAPQARSDLAARVDKLEQTASAETAASETTLFSYGEIAYSRPRHDSSETRADLARAVIGFGHRFDENTRAYGEFEWEHAVASADDQGEAEVEQLYVERQFSDRIGARAGLMLVPLGLLNESHEPTVYYGVFRNFVETAIIPTTWREGGVALYGASESGLHWNVGVTTGFDLSKWDATSDEGRESPLGSIHQELQLARARDLSIYAAANYQGVPGVTVGGGVFTGKAGQGAQNFAAPDARVTLWEGHARWQTGPFDLSALYARGTISGTEALNLTFVGDPTPVPKSFWGAYVQGAWHAWSKADYSLVPFTRYEWFNTAAAYEPVPQGLGVAPSPTEGVWTIGANFNVGPNIVLKADYQKFKVDTARDRFDLGFGYSF